MDKNKKSNEGEMGSGDSDDEFYNVKLPYTPTNATDKTAMKVEVKKVYSPPRTKVKYDYKFDSSSDEESESASGKKEAKMVAQESSEKCSSGKEDFEKRDIVKENVNLPQSTFKVVEKINEELKNMKNAGTKAKAEKLESLPTSQTHLTSSLPSAINVPRPQIGIVPPVVVMPPAMVVPPAPVMNMSPMMVPSGVGMGSQTIMPGSMSMMSSQNMMGIAGNILRSPNSIGGLMASPSNSIPNSMMGMNSVQNQMAGIMGMQGNIVGMQGNTITGQGNVIGIQNSMISPATMGGMNMAVQGNLMRVAGSGNNMIRMQGAGNNILGMQGTSSMMGISRPNSNIMGVSRPLGVPGPSSNMMGVQSAAGMVVNPGNIINNPMMSNAGSLMVMGAMMGNPGNMISSMGNPNVVCSNQTTLINSPANLINNNNVVRMVNNSQGSAAVRAVPPPFVNIRGKPPMPGNFRWQANPRMQSNAPKVSSPNSSNPLSSPNIPSPASSPFDQGTKEYDGDELSREDKDKSLSDKSSPLETDESQSPPRELPNTFKNDGSFMEIFKKMKDESSQEATSSNDKPGENSANDSSSSIKKPTVMLSGIVGKRRGGRVLKTGLVKKVKKETETDEEKHPKDAWSMYMAEVKKYREASCEEEGKTRPLVK